ncbi:MAG: SapC family protein [Helicobacter sp.]|nr:SapC family protein [Helicobacter sp.]MDE5816523.1 SapC family protein [Helicobacter sp.]MDE6043902.1 SapC family protein [Helicobacter sp.]MDE7196271.1 SapC family protein [Helicobacter sp.]
MAEQIKTITPISKRNFANRRYKRFPHFGHAARDSVMPLVMLEIRSAMMDIPLVFLKEKEGYGLYGIASFLHRFNALLDGDGRFRTSYIPACYRAYPFLFANIETGEKVLCFDESSGLLVEEGGTEGLPFFDENGNTTQNVQEIMLLIKSIADSVVRTKQVIGTLDSFGLIAPWDLNITLDGTTQKIEGFYTISEERLLQLRANDLATLRDNDALALAYAQVFSKQHVRQIEQLCNWILAAEKSRQQNLIDHKGDLDLEFLNNETIPV